MDQEFSSNAFMVLFIFAWSLYYNETNETLYYNETNESLLKLIVVVIVLKIKTY